MTLKTRTLTIQKLLTEWGFNPGPVDGIPGTKTRAALQRAFSADTPAEPRVPAKSLTFNKPRRPVERVFIHCSASDHAHHDNVATMDKWHRARGWSGVGYHFFVRKSGQLEVGRNIEKIPAAQGGKSVKAGSVKGGNRGTIAICLHGLEEDKFTAEQFATLRGLCLAIDSAYRGKVTFHGHREVAFKSCPVFDYKSVLGLDDAGRL